MPISLKKTFELRSTNRRRKFFNAAALMLCTIVAAHESRAQQRNLNPSGTSDLGVQNFSRVGATAAEIKAVLLKDAGLMVELKRWVAKDATDHGQVVSDSDLSSDAIFQRLEVDVPFRSVATLLVQRYGYLLPKLNPDSNAGKENELLIQERTKWMAKRQEQDLEQTRQEGPRNPESLISCDPQTESECDGGTRPASLSGNSGQRVLPNGPLFENVPDDRVPSNLPGGTGAPLLRTQGPQSESGTGGESALLPVSNSYGAASSQYNANLNPSDMSATLRSGTGGNRFSGGTLSTANPAGKAPNDGLMAAFDNSVVSSPAIGAPQDGMNAGNSTRAESASLDSAMNPRSSPLTRSRGAQSGLRPEPLEMVRKANPYNDIPSLYDMYVQTVPKPSAPRRFGSEVFQNGTRDSQLIPMDLPVGPDYVVGPGDGLSVELWGGVSQRLYRVVDREGRLSLPEVGPIMVSGKSLAALQQDLQQVLRSQFRNVSADVSLARLRTIRVYEVGDVANPGAYDISSLSTPLNALFSAGGPTQRGSMRILKHYRGSQLVQTVDTYDLLLHGVKTDLQRLENGDTVQIPPIGPQVTVEGMVHRPAIYELRDERTLADVLELAGGLLPSATLRHVEVQRLVAHDKQTMLSVDVPEADSGDEAIKKLAAFEVHDGDRIRIFPIEPYNQDTIYLEGHVVRPGRYSFHADMHLTDVITSFKDLLPEPATQYAEIIRLNAPDFHPSVEGFDLSDALANPSQSPQLHAMDTIRIFSRFDFENPPSISVLGDVRAPGTYQTSGQVHLTDAVHLAGGLSPDAQTGDAQVFRHLPDGKFKIFSVSLSQALSGDPIENIVLQPRDRLLIHRNPDAVDPATVYIQGEVARPGRYPLTSNMRVADLIRAGGGLQPSADTQGADLTKYQWTDQGKSELGGRHEAIVLSAALAGDAKSNLPLQNGDVLTIRQLPGWTDLGASIALKGEVKHPGTYGIRPGERLSSVLERAGGFQPGAYPFGAVLQRSQVRDLEANARNEIILRVKSSQDSLEALPATDPKEKHAKELAIQQWQGTLDQLSANPPLGRVTIRVSSQIDHWRNTNADIEVRAGDTLIIPKRPSYVMVTGQVFNATAVSYRPGKSAKWYLSQSGGPTQLANKKAIFVVRADGSVIGTKSSLWSGESLSATLQPGDTVVVPERALGGGVPWQSVLLTAQTAASIASAVFVAVHY